MNIIKKAIIVSLTQAIFIFPAFAGVGLNQTRIIIEGDKNSAAITARNTENTPFLVANFVTEKLNKNPVDNGYFVITPQVFKLESNSSNTIKIQAIPNNFPADRESMYYFHSRNIPATNGKDGMKIGLENIVKIFYRPAGLAGNVQASYDTLTIIPDSNGINIKNPSPYFINLHTLRVNGKLVKLTNDNNIIRPYSEVLYTTTDKSGLIKWSVINDLGGINEFSKQI